MTSAPPIELVRDALLGASAGQGFNAWLGCGLDVCETGRVEVTISVRPEMTQHHGFVHGGVVGAMADIACSWAAATAAGDVVSSTYTIQFLSPAKGERLRATGVVIKAGKRSVSVEARVHSESSEGEPKLVAIAMAQIAPVGG